MKNKFDLSWPLFCGQHPSLRSASQHWLALSGGVDSIALLALLAEKLPNLRAVHVDHGLQPQSADWAQRCVDLAAKRGVICDVLTLTADEQQCKQLGIEGWARQARYQALSAHVSAGDIIHTAHHQQDQAESFMLAVMRGAGINGLAAMPTMRPLGEAWLARPILNYSQQDVIEFAELENLEWIDDPSNQDSRFDRNYLRHHVLPNIQQRWPSAPRQIAKSAGLAAEAREVNAWLLDRLLDDSCSAGNCFIEVEPKRFSAAFVALDELTGLPDAVRSGLLRRWIERCALPPIPFAKMKQVERDVLAASESSCPLLTWQGVELRRYGGKLWLYLASEALVLPSETISVGNDLTFGSTLLRLHPSASACQVQIETNFRVTLRQGGERFVRGDHHLVLKKELQARRVFPWCRDYLPLIWRENELVAVAGLWQQPEDQLGWQLQWLPAPRVLLRG